MIDSRQIRRLWIVGEIDEKTLFETAVISRDYFVCSFNSVSCLSVSAVLQHRSILGCILQTIFHFLCSCQSLILWRRPDQHRSAQISYKHSAPSDIWRDAGDGTKESLPTTSTIMYRRGWPRPHPHPRKHRKSINRRARSGRSPCRVDVYESVPTSPSLRTHPGPASFTNALGGRRAVVWAMSALSAAITGASRRRFTKPIRY